MGEFKIKCLKIILVIFMYIVYVICKVIDG